MRPLIVVALLGCANSHAPQTAPPDIFLFTVDTVRADHLGCYGYERNTSPFIDSMAQQGVLFEAAESTSSWTVPALGSLLTGKLPWTLGTGHAPWNDCTAAVEEGRKCELAEDLAQPLLAEVHTSIAQSLKARGYDTLAVIANSHIDTNLGYGRGFDVFINAGFETAREVLNATGPHINAIRQRTKPTFVWVHLFDPHDPYFAHPRVASDWNQGLARAELKLPADERLDTPMMTLLLARNDLKAGSPGLGRLQALYDGEVLFADRALAQLSEAFAIDKGDVVIISSDHGEEFREHGELGHRLNLFETSTHIPMIWRWPDQWSPHRVKTPVSILDIPSTIAAITDSTHNGHGRALLDELRGQTRATPLPIFSELVAERLPKRAVRLGALKWIDGALYDLNTDPQEQVDLASTRSHEATQLAEMIKTQLIEHPPTPPQWLTPTHTEATLQQLEAMGYIEHD